MEDEEYLAIRDVYEKKLVNQYEDYKKRYENVSFNDEEMEKVIIQLLERYKDRMIAKKFDEINTKMFHRFRRHARTYMVKYMAQNDPNQAVKYINSKIKVTDNKKEIIDSILKFNSNINTVSFEDSVAIYEEMFKYDSNLTKVLDNLLKTFGNEVSQTKLYEQISDNTILTVIDLYCKEKGIEIVDDFDMSSAPADNIRDYMKEICDLAITKEKTIELFKKYEKTGKSDNFIRNQIVEGNLRLVVSIAKQYISRAKSMSFLDLIQCGNEGIMKAVDKFDVNRGFQFSTYATWWIRQAVTRSIADQDRPIRMPVHVVESLSKVVKAKRILIDTLDREPTYQEIADYLEISEEFVKNTLKNDQSIVSLSEPIGEEEDTTLEEFISGDADVEKDVIKKLTNEAVDKELSVLTPREKAVLMKRFGFDGEEETLEQVGKEFGITRERIRQIEAKAIRKLRLPNHKRNLSELHYE